MSPSRSRSRHQPVFSYKVDPSYLYDDEEEVLSSSSGSPRSRERSYSRHRSQSRHRSESTSSSPSGRGGFYALEKVLAEDLDYPLEHYKHLDARYASRGYSPESYSHSVSRSSAGRDLGSPSRSASTARGRTRKRHDRDLSYSEFDVPPSAIPRHIHIEETEEPRRSRSETTRRHHDYDEVYLDGASYGSASFITSTSTPSSSSRRRYSSANTPRRVPEETILVGEDGLHVPKSSSKSRRRRSPSAASNSGYVSLLSPLSTFHFTPTNTCYSMSLLFLRRKKRTGSRTRLGSVDPATKRKARREALVLPNPVRPSVTSTSLFSPSDIERASVVSYFYSFFFLCLDFLCF